MYQAIIKKVVELGDTLPAVSGHAVDIGKSKQFLTEKDIEIETKLTELINTFDGNHSVFAEELHSTFIANENVWIIDPISNTVNFIHGMPHYSVVLSHLHKGEVKFAVVYDPTNKELFSAEKGKGTFLNNKRVYVSKRKESLLFLMNQSQSEREKISQILEALEKGSVIRNLGSYGVHYAYVACGRADAAVTFNYDTFPEFAGKLLVEEAGGQFSDFKGGPLDAETVGIIASNGVVHEDIKKVVNGVV